MKNLLLFTAVALLFSHCTLEDPVQNFTISGNILIPGYSADPFGEIHEFDVQVQLISNDEIIATSHGKNFSFPQLKPGRSYSVVPSAGGPGHFGISAIDFVELRKYLEGTLDFTIFQKLVADFNVDGTIDQQDLDEMWDCLLDKNNCSTWRFVSTQNDVNGPVFIDAFEIEKLSSDHDVEFKALKLGDINNSG